MRENESQCAEDKERQIKQRLHDNKIEHAITQNGRIHNKNRSSYYRITDAEA